MYKKQVITRALTVASIGAMFYLFLVQAHLALKPFPLRFDSMRVAYGYTNVTFSGTVYTDEGSTNIGANKTVAISINGAAAAATDETDANGAYSISG